MKTADYFRGQRDLWKQSYNRAAQKLYDLEGKELQWDKKAKELGDTIYQLEKEREQLQMQIQSKDEQIRRFTEKSSNDNKTIDQLHTWFKDLLADCFTINNASAEERLSYIRHHEVYRERAKSYGITVRPIK